MKIKVYVVALIFILVIGGIGLSFLAAASVDASLDTAAANDIVSTIKNDWSIIEQPGYTLPGTTSGIDYAVIDRDGKLLRATGRDISEDENVAIKHRDTIIPLLDANGGKLGTIIFYNNTDRKWRKYQTNLLIGCGSLLAVCGILGLLLLLQIHRRILKPFHTLKDFASSVAAGSLDIPLAMDRSNAFGAFSESFDLMRTELAAARESEQRANQSKKELVATLSHDIKTPIASIKAVSELMAVGMSDEKSKAQLDTITEKADQIDLLINNMFHATLEELQELKVSINEISSREIRQIIENADYLHFAAIESLPDCLIAADPMRFQQVMDNIFSNSYKYANTAIRVSATLTDVLTINIADYGAGVSEEELPLLTQKYFRGANAKDKSGTGIGLFISAYFMQKMNGSFECINHNGFTVQLILSLI